MKHQRLAWRNLTEDDNSQSETDQVTTAAGCSSSSRTDLNCARIAFDHLAGAIVGQVLDGKSATTSSKAPYQNGLQYLHD
jgi:hypothetical protein